MVEEKKNKDNTIQKSQHGQLMELRDQVLQTERVQGIKECERTGSNGKVETIFVMADYPIAQERQEAY